MIYCNSLSLTLLLPKGKVQTRTSHVCSEREQKCSFKLFLVSVLNWTKWLRTIPEKPPRETEWIYNVVEIYCAPFPVEFPYSEFVTFLTFCCLAVFPEILKILNCFPVNFNFSDAANRYYTGIQIILYRLFDVHKKYYYRLRKTKYVYLNSF